MKAALLLSLCLAIAPVNAIEQAGNRVTLTDDEMQQCNSEGGCYVMTKDSLMRAMHEVQKRALMGCGKQS